ncbi:hypothetical protein JND45_15680, partial [Listeria monocytogenes]|nr:hypothetical protein [Listeria monocytogenes]
TFSYAPVFGDDGSVAGVLCLTNETTATVLQTEAKRQADMALEESQRSLQRAQEAGQVGLFAIDLGTGTLTGTAEFFKLFGLQPLPSI